MQPLMEHFHPTFYPLQTSNRCYPTLKSLYLPTTMHLPVSSEDTLHFYRYLHTHIFIANRQFLLLIDVPIQDGMQQISIYRVFTFDIPHGNFTACYEIDTKYLRSTWNETMAVEVLNKQYSTCKEANGQF